MVRRSSRIFIQMSCIIILLQAPAYGQDVPSNVGSPRCSIDIEDSDSASLSQSVVMNVSDGTYTRCASVVIPDLEEGIQTLPILFDFHGSGGSRANYPGSEKGQEGNSWADLAVSGQFAIIGGEALQFEGRRRLQSVSEQCIQCFADAGCESDSSTCTSCLQTNQESCSSACIPSPFDDAISAICGGNSGSDEDSDNWSGGQWLIPQIQNDSTGLVCDWQNNQDLRYINELVSLLSSYTNSTGNRIFDTERIFFTGCSMGSAFAIYVAQCMHQDFPSRVSAFATQSTGLKVKGDGNTFPPDNYEPEYTWGECPDCKYFPAPVVQTQGLKVCIDNGDEDPSSSDPFFYRSSQALEEAWEDAGMRVETNYHSGGHCETKSFDWITECLDDGTGRLVQGKDFSNVVAEEEDSFLPLISVLILNLII